MDLVILMSNGASVLTACLNTVVQAVLIVLQSVGANFLSIVVLSTISFAMHQYTSDTLSLLDVAYRKFYIFFYRRIIESYGWFLRVLYEMFVPVYNMAAFLTKKLMLKDVAETFGTCENKPRFGLTIFFNILNSMIRFVGEFLESLFTWLVNFTSSELDLRNAWALLGEMSNQFTQICPARARL